MAIEGITGAVSTYQTTPKVAKVEQPDTTKTASSYSGEEGTVSEISKDTRIVNGADDAAANKNGEDKRQPSEEMIKQTLKDINKKLNNTECIFGLHEETNRVTIQIVDKDTKEVIKELPPEKTLDMIAKAWELAGILVDERL